MATTPVSSSSTTSGATSTANSMTAAQLEASKKASAQKILSSLSAGSGVDVTSLAQNLVDTERIPRENAINTKISKNDAKVSGISAVMFMVTEFQKALTAVKDKNSFNNLTVNNSDSSQVNVTASNSAASGTHQVKVLSLSQPQRSVSNTKSSGTESLSSVGGLEITLTSGDQSSPVLKTVRLQTGASGGTSANGSTLTGIQFGTTPSTNDFNNFSINIDGVQREVLVAPATADVQGLATSLQKQLRTLQGDDDISVVADNSGQLSVTSASGKTITGITLTPQTYDDNLDGAAKAINASNQGYTAKVVNDGSFSKLVITGANGSGQGFSITTNNANLSFATPPLQEAADASLVVDGIEYTRNSNSITDILPGVTLDLRYPSTTNNPSTIALTRDTSTLKANLAGLVTAYNDLNNIIKETTNPKSTLEIYGATLVGNNTVRLVLSQIRSSFFSISSTPGGNYKTLNQIGFSLDQTGVLNLDESKLDAALQGNVDDISKMFTGGFNNLSKYAKLPAGLAGDTIRKLGKLLEPTGPLVTQTNNAESENTKYRAQLSQLEKRMAVLLARYQKQFAAMDSLVGSANSQRASLKTTFDGMMSMYTNKN